MDRQDEEGPSPGALGDDGQESRVDGAEVVVLDAAGDGHAIEAALLGGGLTEHVAELGAPVLRTPCHLQGGRGARERGRRRGRSVKESRLQLCFSQSCSVPASAEQSHGQRPGLMHFSEQGAVGGRGAPRERQHDNNNNFCLRHQLLPCCREWLFPRVASRYIP